jgi:ankyrin repeat protein
VKGRTVFKWAIGVIAVVVLIGVGAVVSLFIVGFISLEKGEQHRRQFQAEQDSGRWDFGDQPALFAVAQGIVKNDPDVIRAASKGLPDLQAPGRDGATLLNFAVMQSWQRPESVDAIRTLLSLGADPNYTNGNRNSFAMANAVHASAPVLRAMLEAGGNPNTRDEFGRPVILMNWYLGYYENQARSRLELLVDHGADVNSAMPKDGSDSAGYPLLLYRTAMGLKDNLAYADALLLLERGADPNGAGSTELRSETC